MAEVLLFNIEKGKAIKIKNLCRQIHISYRDLTEKCCTLRVSTEDCSIFSLISSAEKRRL